MDFGSRLKQWCRKGFPELGDFAGMGIGATTHKVLSHEKYDKDPHFVRIKFFFIFYVFNETLFFQLLFILSIFNINITGCE